MLGAASESTKMLVIVFLIAWSIFVYIELYIWRNSKFQHVLIKTRITPFELDSRSQTLTQGGRGSSDLLYMELFRWNAIIDHVHVHYCYSI